MRSSVAAACVLALLVVTDAAGPGARADAPAPAPRGPSAAVLRILARLVAKEACTCLYVHDNDPKSCQAFLQRHAPMVSWSTSAAERSTEAHVAEWSARARWRDAQTGCVLDAD
jgi:hypothetical protein